MAYVNEAELEARLQELALRERRLIARENEIDNRIRIMNERDNRIHDENVIAQIQNRAEDAERLLNEERERRLDLERRLREATRNSNDRGTSAHSSHHSRNSFAERRRDNKSRYSYKSSRSNSIINHHQNNITNNPPDREDRALNMPSNAIIRESLAVIPRFDGTNLYKFVRAVNRIKSQFPTHAQHEITRLLKFKLEDHVAVAIELNDYETIEEFLTTLKRTFSNRHSSNYYKGKLATLAKGESESILHFIDRVSEIYTAILDCTCLDEDIEELPTSRKRKLEQEVITEFFFALPPFYRLYTNQRVGTLNAAFKEAIQAEKRITIDNEKYGHTNT